MIRFSTRRVRARHLALAILAVGCARREPLIGSTGSAVGSSALIPGDYQAVNDPQALGEVDSFANIPGGVTVDFSGTEGGGPGGRWPSTGQQFDCDSSSPAICHSYSPNSCGWYDQNATLTVISSVCFSMTFDAPTITEQGYVLASPSYAVTYELDYTTNCQPPAPPAPSIPVGYTPPPNYGSVSLGPGCTPDNPICPQSPLVLNFTSGPISFLGHGVPFDYYGDHTTPLADWISPQFGLLALDLDGDGMITRGAELFGDQTKLPDGTLATNGFQALAQYDANQDGVIDARDPAFAKLLVWFDRNSNGKTDPCVCYGGVNSAGIPYGSPPSCELVTLASQGVTSLALTSQSVHIDGDTLGSFVGLDSTFSSGASTSPSGELADVYFAILPPPPDVTTGGPWVLLFGGETNPTLPPLSDTWAFDGTQWSQLQPTASPPARSAAVGATLGESFVLFGGDSGFVYTGDTWVFSGTTWTQDTSVSSPSVRANSAMASLGGNLVLFGGSTGNAELGDTWIFDGGTWTQSPASGPIPRSYAGMVPLGDELVLFGGFAGAALGDTWTFDGAVWTQLPVTSGPSARYGFAMAPLGSLAVLFGGGSNDNDTWTFDGTTWTQVTVATPPPGRFNPAMAPLGSGAVVMFGGEDLGGNAFGDTWVFDGTSWTASPVVNGPSARVGSTMVAFP
jgi:hypothetical protein